MKFAKFSLTRRILSVLIVRIDENFGGSERGSGYRKGDLRKWKISVHRSAVVISFCLKSMKAVCAYVTAGGYVSLGGWVAANPAPVRKFREVESRSRDSPPSLPHAVAIKRCVTSRKIVFRVSRNTLSLSSPHLNFKCAAGVARWTTRILFHPRLAVT